MDRNQEKINTEKASELAQAGQYARAFTSLGSLGIAKHNDDTYKKLLDKHPQDTSNQDFNHTSSSQPITFSVPQVHKGIKSFKREQPQVLME